MRVHAKAGKGEFHHIGAPNHNKASTTQPLHCGRIQLRRRGSLQHHRTGAGRDARFVIQILHADRDAGIGARRAPRLAQSIHRAGSRAGCLMMHHHEGAAALTGRIGNARQGFFHQSG